MISIIDYGLGNLNSIKNMLRRLGYRSEIINDSDAISRAEKIILPGVGAFDNGMHNIQSKGFTLPLYKKAKEEKVPILGICLGMQLLFSSSEEGCEKGLGFISGHATRFKFDDKFSKYKVPHMGWNEVKIVRSHPLVNNLPEDARFYFVHSYKIECANKSDVILTADYGGDFTAAVAHENIMGTQFHPEKSHRFGMILLKNFAEM